jgi:glucose-1-phosphate adenylyltransferase
MPGYNVVAVVLGGGAGTRLQPLTQVRAKPAVPIAGKYRLVDIPISNCINSEIRRIYLLTQYNSVSLHQHVQSTYVFDPYHQGFVRILAAQQTPGSDIWFQGTADAVRQTLGYIMDERPEYVIILSGDQLYRMDFRELLAQHEKTRAEITLAAKPVDRAQAGALGIMEVEGDRRIARFVEKPGAAAALEPLRAPMFDEERYLASMGIYLFNTDVLIKLLDNARSDFGRDIIPEAIQRHRACGYIFDAYWRDIGTIGAFWEANLALTDPLPQFSFYDPDAPVYTHMRYLPPSKIGNCQIYRALVSEGCILTGAQIDHAVVGVRAVVGEETVIKDAVLMGADEIEHAPAEGTPRLGIGRDCIIRKAIVDKDVRIGDGCHISPEGKEDGSRSDLFTVRDGVIVIPKKTVIPAGTVL